MLTYGIAPDANPTDNFIEAGNAWYTNYLAAAKRLGVSGGAGDDKFAPDPAITRQEMFTPLKILKHFLLPNVQRALPLSYRPCRAHNDKPQGKKPCGLSFLVEIIGIESLTS